MVTLGVGIAGSGQKTGQRMPRSGHSEHPAGVRHQFGMLSAFSVERCPPSRWNTVRHQHGIVSAIAWNTQMMNSICREAGMNDYLTKPLDADEILEAFDARNRADGGENVAAIDATPARARTAAASPAGAVAAAGWRPSQGPAKGTGGFEVPQGQSRATDIDSDPISAISVARRTKRYAD